MKEVTLWVRSEYISFFDKAGVNYRLGKEEYGLKEITFFIKTGVDLLKIIHAASDHGFNSCLSSFQPSKPY